MDSVVTMPNLSGDGDHLQPSPMRRPRSASPTR